MKFYIYKIENLVNNKKYIGITENPEQRKNNHFTKLRHNKHCNIRLQNAWNKYGEDNFKFEIIFELDCEKEEAYKCEEAFIEKEKGYTGGYNGNRGGLEHNGAKGLFEKEDIFKILATHERHPRSGTIIAEIYGCARRTIGNIIQGNNYHSYYTEYNSLSEQTKQNYYEDFLDNTNFKDKIFKRKKDSLRKLESFQIYMLLYQEEFGFPKTKKMLLDNFGISGYSIWQMIKEGKSYQKEVYEYNNMTFEEKAQILCHYMATYNSKSPELLGTPTK